MGRDEDFGDDYDMHYDPEDDFAMHYEDECAAALEKERAALEEDHEDA